MARSKFGAVRCEADGHKFDSLAERQKYFELKLLASGPKPKIRNLELQPKFPIVIEGEPLRNLPDKLGRRGRPVIYTADFSWFEGSTRRVIDVKGMDTEASRLRRALAEHIYRIKIEVVK